MGARVIITIDGLDKVISTLSSIENKAEGNLEKQTATLARDTGQAWQDVTHRRSGRLQAGEIVDAQGLSFTLKSSTYYYNFVDKGHNTPAGWRTKHGYRPAKRRSYVEGQEMTKKAVEFVEENIENYLSKFLDNA